MCNLLAMLYHVNVYVAACFADVLLNDCRVVFYRLSAGRFTLKSRLLLELYPVKGEFFLATVALQEVQALGLCKAPC